MTRDMELVRQILWFLEKNPELEARGYPKIDGYDEGTVQYHMEILRESDLVWSEFRHLESAMHLDEDGRRQLSEYIGKRFQQDAYRLTWSGHEFLDAAKNDTIWKKVVARFQKEGVGMAFELAKMMLFSEAKTHLGIS